MTSVILEPVILKTDGCGRVRTPVAQREALLDAFERRGLSRMKFAVLHGVKVSPLCQLGAATQTAAVRGRCRNRVGIG